MRTKKILSLAFFALLTISASTVKASDEIQTDEFTVNGLKVIHRGSIKDVISVRLFIKGGVNNYTADKAGVEGMAFDLAMQGGTESMDKNAFAAAADAVGTSFGASSGRDYGNLSMICLKDYWDKSWNLFADAIMHPAMPQDEFNVLQQQAIAGAKQRSSSADGHLSDLAYDKAFAGSPYATDPSGTEETLSKLTLQDVKDHYNSVLGKKRAFLVVVGDISNEDLKKKVEASLAKMAEGTPAEMHIAEYQSQPSAYVEDRDLTTNYISGIMSAPLRSDDAFVSDQLAMSMMHDRFFTELRTKRSLSYAPAAYVAGLVQHPYNKIYISTTDPKQSMEVMVGIIDSLKRDGFTDKELKGTKLSFLTSHFMGQETNADISQTLGMYEVLGNWKLADEWTDKVMKTSLQDVNSTFRKYNSKINWTYLGKESDVSPDDFVQPKAPTELKK